MQRTQAFPMWGRWREAPDEEKGCTFWDVTRLHHPKPPLCKGRWHGEAVTKGLRGRHLQIGMHQCDLVQSNEIAVGAGFCPSRRYNVTNLSIPMRNERCCVVADCHAFLPLHSARAG